MFCNGEKLTDVDHDVGFTELSKVVDEYVEYGRRVRDLEEETVKAQRRYIDRFLAAESVSLKGLASLTAAGLERFFFKYSKSHRAGARQWMQFSLCCFLRFCYHHEYISSDLSTAIPAFRSQRRLSSVPRAIDDVTIQLLLKSLDPKSPTGLRDLAIIWLLVTYGVRGEHIRQLRLDDVDWAGSQIHFRPVKRGKAVDQHLTTEVGNSLLAYIRDARPNDAPYAEVFLTSRAPCHPFSLPGSLSSMIARRLRRINAQLPEGVSRGTHSFRHAFAGRLTGQVPLKHIADMLGHRDISSSYLYSKVDFKALSEAAQPWPEEVER